MIKKPIVPGIILLLVTGILASCAHIAAPVSTSEIVTVSDRKILVNGEPYFIKGICYHPTPKGSATREFSQLTEDLTLMVEAGINTIRVYVPIDDVAVLDEIHAAGLKVIIGFGYDQKGIYDIASGSFIDYVNKYKDHSAILLWELGNEYNFHPEWFGGDINNWYTAMNNAAELIHQVDRSHPVSTAHGELPSAVALAASPNIDVWGLNVYRWDKPEEIFSQWAAISSKPMFFSEAGADSYMAVATDQYQQGVNEKAQADATDNILKEVFENSEVCAGVAVFAFIDELWKAGNNHTLDIGGAAPYSSGVPYDGAANEEYWGLVDIDRNKKRAYEIVKAKYTEPAKPTK